MGGRHPPHPHPPPPLYVRGLTRLKRTPQPYLDRAFFAETRVRGWGGVVGRDRLR